MMKLVHNIGAAAFMTALLLTGSGCQNKESPMEKAGKEVDQAVDKIQPSTAGPAEQAGQTIDKAADKAGQQIEMAGDRIQDAAKGDDKK